MSTSQWDPPGLVGAVAKWIDECAIHPAPVLSVAAALTCVSTLVGRHYACGDTRGAVYVVAVARSGVGKDVGRRCAANLIARAGYDARIGTDDIASASGLVARLRKHPIQLFLLDEFGRMIEAFSSKNAGSHERQIITTLMKLWSSAGDTYYGKAYAEKDTQKVEQPYCVVYGTTTPEVFYRSLRGSDVVDGVLSRVLLVECAHGQAEAKQPTGRAADPPADLIGMAQDVIRGGIGQGNVAHLDVADVRATPMQIPMTPEAQAGYTRLQAAIRPKLDEPFAELWVRAREQALRVALVVAAGRCSRQIEESDLKWAWAFVRWCTKGAYRTVTTRVADTEEGRCALLMLEVIGKRRATKAELTRAAWRFDKRIRADALTGLVDKRAVIGEPELSRGRISMVYRLAEQHEIDDNPDSLADFGFEQTSTIDHPVVEVSSRHSD